MTARRVLIIFCPGAVSHVDTFDYKPDLIQRHGEKPPGLPSVTFEGPSGNIAKPFWDFKPRGQSGKMISELLLTLESWLMNAVLSTHCRPPPVLTLKVKTFYIPE